MSTLSQDKQTIIGSDGQSYRVGSPEATDYLLKESKPLLEPTIGQTYKEFNAPITSAPADAAIEAGVNLYQNTDTKPIDEDAIRRATIARFQQEVDAVNSVFGEKLREAKVQGLSRLGSSNAIAARSGTLGSDFGMAQNEKVKGDNTAIENSIEQERLAKIEAIFNTADAAATNEIAAKRKAQTEGLDSYLKYLGAKTERKSANVKSVVNALITQKLDPSEIDPGQLRKIADSLGVTVEELTASYQADKKAADDAAREKLIKQAKDSRVELGEGQALYEIQSDGTYKFLGKNPKTFSPTAGAGSKLSRNEIVRLGLPLSLVDVPEKQVYAQLDSPDIPAWFKEKAEKEANQSLPVETLGSLWDTARVEIKKKAETDPGSEGDIDALVQALTAAASAQ